MQGAQDDEELHSGSESVEIESEKDASLQEKTTSREPSIADEGYEFGEDVNGVASEGENASVYESDAESGVSQRDEDEDAGDDDEEDGEDEEGEEVQQPAESGSESGGEETSGRLRDFADPESRSAKEGAKANAYDKDMETNLGSSGFESLQEELYLPFAEKISKSLTAADSTRVSSTSAPLTKRAKDLMQIVKLNTLSYNIYDNPSINYEVFVKLFGKKTAKQAATQTVERGECETQTESITSQDKSVQHPFAAQGGQGPFEMSCATRCDPFKLSHFLLKAEKIVQLVSEEDGERRSANERSSAKSAKRIMKTPAGSEQFCAAFYKLVCSPLAKNMPISFLANDSQYLFSAQAMVKDGGEKSLVCLWPLEQTTNPEHLLIARSLVSCCGSASNGRVVAGMSDGSLALWELREPRHMHKEVLLGSASCTLRSPSFSTACATSANAMHQSAVIAVKTLSGNDEERGCQIASIDEEGLVVLWEIQETFQKDTSYMEEGMHPGGSVKLLKKTSIVALKAASKERHSVRCVGTPPNEVANIYLGTACGKVVRSARFSDNSMLPLEYGVEFCELISAVTCIDFNPVKCTSFLVGYDDGTLSLFSLQDSNPQIVWDAADTNLSELRSVQWVRNKPSVFVVLDSTSTIYLWDLESSQAPLFNFSLSKYVAIVWQCEGSLKCGKKFESNLKFLLYLLSTRITLMTIFSDANHSAIVS